MKNGLLVLSVLTFLFFLSTSSAMACSCGGKAATGISASNGHCSGGQSSCSEDATPIKNINCPVSGQPVGSMGEAATYTYKGKTYQLCCTGCIERFKADPEKYLKKMEQNG